MRSIASLAGTASCAGTLMRFTTLPSTRFSSVHARCCGSIRCMVEHMHTVGAMNCTVLPSCFTSSARRFTRFSSVPTQLPATPIDGGGASSVALGYPEVARRVVARVIENLRPAAR